MFDRRACIKNKNNTIYYNINTAPLVAGSNVWKNAVTTEGTPFQTQFIVGKTSDAYFRKRENGNQTSHEIIAFFLYVSRAVLSATECVNDNQVSRVIVIEYILSQE